MNTFFYNLGNFLIKSALSAKDYMSALKEIAFKWDNDLDKKKYIVSGHLGALDGDPNENLKYFGLESVYDIDKNSKWAPALSVIRSKVPMSGRQLQEFWKRYDRSNIFKDNKPNYFDVEEVREGNSRIPYVWFNDEQNPMEIYSKKGLKDVMDLGTKKKLELMYDADGAENNYGILDDEYFNEDDDMKIASYIKKAYSDEEKQKIIDSSPEMWGSDLLTLLPSLGVSGTGLIGYALSKHYKLDNDERDTEEIKNSKRRILKTLLYGSLGGLAGGVVGSYGVKPFGIRSILSRQFTGNLGTVVGAGLGAYLANKRNS